jgi:hypothetical protein
LTNFSKEFYHWLVVCHNETQRGCVLKVALKRTKLAKENEPEENTLGFSEYTQNQQLIKHVIFSW